MAIHMSDVYTVKARTVVYEGISTRTGKIVTKTNHHCTDLEDFKRWAARHNFKIIDIGPERDVQTIGVSF
jgi:hypothetical protein